MYVCYRYAIMLEEAAEWELRQLDNFSEKGIRARNSVGISARPDSRVGLHSQDPCMDIRSARPPARPVRRLVRGSAEAGSRSSR